MTTQTGHTPGPWNVEWPYILGADKRQTVVAEIVGAVSNETAKADARLIAAAPDLLTLAREVAGTRSSDAWGNVVDRARAAIAKAEANG